jgi:hypothetical protein
MCSSLLSMADASATAAYSTTTQTGMGRRAFAWDKALPMEYECMNGWQQGTRVEEELRRC